MTVTLDEEDDLLGVVLDHWGRTVVFTRRRLEHVQRGHPEVSALDVKTAIRYADTRTRGNRRYDEVLWCETVGRSRFMTVVVAYEGEEGWVRTAHLLNKPPREEDRIG